MYSQSPGVIIELVSSMNKLEMIETALAFFASQQNLDGKLVIIGVNKIRIIER